MICGTHEAKFGEIPATGDSFKTQGTGVVRLKDGLIDEYGLVFDCLGMIEQLNLVN